MWKSAGFWASVNGNKERDRMSQILSKNGRIPMEEQEVREHWKDHFEGLYRGADNPGEPTLCKRVPQEDGSEIKEEEVRRGVMRLKVKLKCVQLCQKC